MWLEGVELVEPESEMCNVVQYYGDSYFGPLGRCGVDVDKN